MTTTDGEAKGYRLDRSGAEENNPLFGRPRIPGEHDDEVPDVTAVSASFQSLGEKKESWTAAMLHDPFGVDINFPIGPEAEEAQVLSDLSFETSAFCLMDNGSIGRFLGSVRWGCVVMGQDAEVQLLGLFPGAIATPSIPFRESAKEWNKFKRPNLVKLPENDIEPGDKEK